MNLLRREADVAIRVAPRAPPEQQGLVVRKLGSLPLARYATRAHVVESHAWLLVHAELHATARVRAVVDHVVSEMKSAQPLIRGLD